MIKPIETIYKGYRFRSRIEARWAVFFDALGVEWEYEREGYKMETDQPWGKEILYYLPDFFVKGIYTIVPLFFSPSNQEIAIEIKNSKVLWEDRLKVMTLAEKLKIRSLLISGLPNDYTTEYSCLQEFVDTPKRLIKDYDCKFINCPSCNAIYLISDSCMFPHCLSCGEEDYIGDNFVNNAILRAQQSRFEHGECG